MGQLISAYRHHPQHGIPISQEIVGQWANQSQAQVSRYENGSPDKQMDRLIFWARLLRFPDNLLWFAMPEESVGSTGRSTEVVRAIRDVDDVWADRYPRRVSERGSLKQKAHERVGAQPVTMSSPALAGSPIANIRNLRIQLDQALAAATVSSRQLEMIEQSTHDHLEDYPATGPTVMLVRIVEECAEVLMLTRRRQPAAIQSRLSACAALLATMCADALMRLGETGDARSWYRTAVIAADDSGQRSLGVLARAQAAMLPFYFGCPQRTVQLTNEALALSSQPCPSTALAAAGRARALARIGAREEARSAINDARRLFDEAGDDEGDAAFQFPAKRLLFYLSGAAAWSGETAAAYRLQDEALGLYRASGTPSIDPSLILMDRSFCLVKDRRTREAAAVARDAMASLATPQRTEIVLTRAHDVIDAVDPSERDGSIRDLDDYVRECRRSSLTLPKDRAILES